MIDEDFRSVLIVLLKTNLYEIYYLAGQSSVILSFEKSAKTIQSVTQRTLNLFEGCRMMCQVIRIYHADSGESFGDTKGILTGKITLFHPISPYAVAKISAYWLVNNYREAYRLFAFTDILFNHESLLRPEHFLTRRFIRAVKGISEGSIETLKLGLLGIPRDWRWAP